MLKDIMIKPKLIKEKFFTIVIPVKEKNEYLMESIKKCLELSYDNFEILIFPDKSFQYDDQKVRIIPTGNIGPAEKRDLAIRYAKGEIFAFLDDDAYPVKDWLANSIKHFKDRDIAAVCGPAITPDDDNIIQKLSGEILSSAITSGNTTYRYKPKQKKFEVDDFPSVNFLVRKKVFIEINGFDSKFWPGEDTKLCLDIINLGKKIIYDPNILVYHHRRKSFKKHLIQVFQYAFHRGYFVKKFPKNSLKFYYFVPSLFLFFAVIGFITSFFNIHFYYFYIATLLFYLILLIINSIAKFIINKNLIISLLLVPGIFLTHLFYGSGFFKGLISREVLK